MIADAMGAIAGRATITGPELVELLGADLRPVHAALYARRTRDGTDGLIRPVLSESGPLPVRAVRSALADAALGLSGVQR